MVPIVAVAEKYAASYRECLDVVAREHKYLAQVEALPLERIREFVQTNGSVKMKGGCHCGAVSYEVTHLDSLGHCHCITCRKTHSAAFATTGGVKRENFRWITGEDKLNAMNRHRGSDGSFVRSADLTLSQSATDRLMLFCEPQRSMRIRVFGRNVTFGARTTCRGLSRMQQSRPIRSGHRKDDSRVRDT
jgi:hypothetical protein